MSVREQIEALPTATRADVERGADLIDRSDVLALLPEPDWQARAEKAEADCAALHMRLATALRKPDEDGQ